MPISHLKLTIQNPERQTLTFEMLNKDPDKPTTPGILAELIMTLLKQVGEATTMHPGFIEWGNDDTADKATE